MAKSATLELIMTMRDQASGGLRAIKSEVHGIGQAAGASHGPVGLLHQALSIAGGLGIVEGIRSVARAIQGLAGDAFEAVASHERLTLSLESLIAREIKNASGVEQTIVVGQQRLELTQKEREKLDELRAAHERYSAQLAVDRERLQEAMAKGKESAAEIELRRVRLAQLEDKVQETATAIANLEAQDGKLVDVTKKVVVGQLSMSDALAQAGPKAKELVNWIETLAIQSPFSQEGVADAFRTAMAYGFTADEAKRLTQANIDFAAASGKSSAVMNQIALALGQIKARGKLAGQEVLQLTNAGVPVRDILARAFGVTTAELEKMQEKGLIPADQAIEAIVKSLEEDFGGAAKRQATSLAGLTESLKDLKVVALRELFTGMFQAAQPYVAAVVDKLSDPSFRTALNEVGTAIGGFIAGGLQRVGEIASALGPELAGLWSSLAAGGAGTFRDVVGWVQANLPLMRYTFHSVMSSLQSIWQSVWPTLKATFDAVMPVIADAIRAAMPIIGQIGEIVARVISDISPLVRQVVTEAAGLIREHLPAIQAIIGQTLEAIRIIWEFVWPILSAVVKAVWAEIKVVIDASIRVIGDVVRVVLAALRGDWGSAWEAMKKLVSDIWDGVKRIVGTALEQIRGLLGGVDWAGLGRGIIDGIVNGVRLAAGALIEMVKGVVGDALGAAKRLLGIQSPSRVAAEQVGRPFVEGIALGLRQAMDNLTRLELPGIMARLALMPSPTAALAPLGVATGGPVINVSYSPAISFATQEEAYELAEAFWAELERRRSRRL